MHNDDVAGMNVLSTQGGLYKKELLNVIDGINTWSKMNADEHASSASQPQNPATPATYDAGSAGANIKQVVGYLVCYV